MRLVVSPLMTMYSHPLILAVIQLKHKQYSFIEFESLCVNLFYSQNRAKRVDIVFYEKTETLSIRAIRHSLPTLLPRR
ncbi:hypothetical protein ALTERO38_60684 [Alteromonas sp. 38]|nr:hypothetical protein ALTER154_40110 [Alteromonas sp. 154]VXC30154.1 hypothetical protein ALTERO38_60684 [Alteromonas sp. 38]